MGFKKCCLICISIGVLKAVSNVNDIIGAYSDEQLTRLIQEFFSQGLLAYKAIVERNFYALRHHFTMYGRFPLSMLVEYQDSCSMSACVHSPAHGRVSTPRRS